MSKYEDKCPSCDNCELYRKHASCYMHCSRFKQWFRDAWAEIRYAAGKIDADEFTRKEKE